MATKQITDLTTPPADPYQPAVWEDHEADKAARRAEREKRRPELRRVLEPEQAAQAEARKPLYEWKVSCTYTRPGAKGKMETISASHQVIAQSERDAWAFFCDKIGAWPGRHSCDLRIDQLSKIN